MEVAEPKYPTVTTLGDNKGLSLPGVWSAPSGYHRTSVIHSIYLQGDAEGLWL